MLQTRFPPICQHGDGTVGIESSAWLEYSRETKMMLAGQVGGAYSPTNEKADLHVEAEER